jgi:hypothetical protein
MLYGCMLSMLAVNAESEATGVEPTRNEKHAKSAETGRVTASTLPTASNVAKKKSPTNATLVKEGLKSNMSAVEATTQLKVLCRKFAALTEKVKVRARYATKALC